MKWHHFIRFTFMYAYLGPDIRDSATNKIPHLYLSAVKARQLLGWGPISTLEEGLRMTIEWYIKFFEEAK